eukprot:s392_g23.t1
MYKSVRFWLHVATFPGDCGSKIFRAICIPGFPVLVQMAEASHCNLVAKIAKGEVMASAKRTDTSQSIPGGLLGGLSTLSTTRVVVLLSLPSPCLASSSFGVVILPRRFKGHLWGQAASVGSPCPTAEAQFSSCEEAAGSKAQGLVDTAVKTRNRRLQS